MPRLPTPAGTAAALRVFSSSDFDMCASPLMARRVGATRIWNGIIGRRIEQKYARALSCAFARGDRGWLVVGAQPAGCARCAVVEPRAARTQRVQDHGVGRSAGLGHRL